MMNSQARRGSAVIFTVIVCMVVATIILFSLIRTGIGQRRQMRREAQAEQTFWLLEGATNLAIKKLSRDPNYSGEKIPIDLETMAIRTKASVDIKVSQRNGRYQVEVQARIGDKPPAMTLRTKTIEIPDSNSVDNAKADQSRN